MIYYFTINYQRIGENGGKILYSKNCVDVVMCSSCIPILSAIGQSDVLYISLTFL